MFKQISLNYPFSGKHSANGTLTFTDQNAMSAKAVHHHLINNNNNNNNNNMISSFVSVIEDTKALSLSDEKERSPQHEPQLGNESSAAASDDLVTLHLLL